MGSLRAVLGEVWAFVTVMIRDVVVAPVRDGTLSLRNHSPVVAGLTWVVTGIVGILTAGIVFANPLRQHAELTAVVDDSGVSIVPILLVPAILFVLALAISLVLAGSARMRLWMRILLFLACIGMLGDLIAASAVAGSSAAWTAWFVFAALVAYCLLIWTGRTRLAIDFFVLLVLTLAITVSSYRGFVAGAELIDADFGLVAMSTLIITLTSLAIPTAFTSGLSAAKLGVSLVVAAGVFAARRTTGPAASLILIGVIAYQIVALAPQLIERWVHEGPLDAVGSTAGTAALIALCVFVWWVVHRVSGRWRVIEKDISEIASNVALPIAYALMAPVLISNVIALFGSMLTLGGSAGAQSTLVAVVQALGSEVVITGARVSVVIGLVAAGVWMTVRHRPRAAAVLLVDAVLLAAVLFATSPIGAAHLDWSVGDLGNLGLVVGIALFGRWALKGALSPDRLVLLYLVVLLSALVRRADYFSLPFGFLIGGSAIALLLIGLVWGYLTGGADLHEDKPHYPRDCRLLLFLGTFLFSIAMLSWSTIGKQIELAGELSAASAFGLVTLGTGYVLVVVLDSSHSWLRANRHRSGLHG